MIDASEMGLPGTVHAAGMRVPPGRYRRVDRWGRELEFPEGGDYETLGGFLTATAGRVPPPGSLVVWGGLTFTVKQADDRRVLKVEIARKPESKPAVSAPPPEKVH